MYPIICIGKASISSFKKQYAGSEERKTPLKTSQVNLQSRFLREQMTLLCILIIFTKNAYYCLRRIIIPKKTWNSAIICLFLSIAKGGDYIFA